MSHLPPPANNMPFLFALLLDRPFRQAMLPLSVLGLVWSLLYLYSGNLLVTVLIHAMWNSRVFLGSLLGL